jgi:hypothetical protein
MDDLLDRIQSLEQHVQSLRQQTTSATRRLRWWRGLAGILVVLSVFSLPLSLGAHKPNHDDDKGAKGLAQRIRALERTLQHVTSVIGSDGFPELVITGANLRLVNGLGRTGCQTPDGPDIPNCPNGLGNLIVGYNELRAPLADDPVPTDLRTGSHNLIVGTENNYSSTGGLIAGRRNEISGLLAVVGGGQGNLASGEISTVSAGVLNTASNNGSTVSGGQFNFATGSRATVSGGVGNTANSFASAVSGGFQNTASGTRSSISGGANRTAEGENDWVAGGLFQDQ